MPLISVDPDLDTPGVALFEDSVLKQAYAGPDMGSVYRAMTSRPAGRLVIEVPQTYDGRAAGGSDANVLIQLARIVGRFEQMAILSGWAITAVVPFAWKGNVPKHICIQRAWDALTPDEQRACGLTTQARKKLARGEGLKSGGSCDAMDAVALGLRALGRTGRALR